MSLSNVYLYTYIILRISFFYQKKGAVFLLVILDWYFVPANIHPCKITSPILEISKILLTLAKLRGNETRGYSNIES
ncbi:hypothetical protein [uncultured Helicobacter sp.]|uniref:hypothetical protein n=1 Tax=uncultured Helicobacter sp. TaxID=175537 RepID=UPI00262BC570|nr:hypothetical protein [uncultured Helicobacter sp.]